MKDNHKIWPIIGTIITVGLSLYGVISYFADKDKNDKIEQLHQFQQSQIEYKMNQRQEEEARSKDPVYQVTNSYKEFKRYKRLEELNEHYDKIQLNKAINQLREWIPKYREMLMEKKDKALSEGNDSSAEACDIKLAELKDIEEEVLDRP